MKISVIIPTYQRQNILARTLPTIFDQDFPADDFEVIVVVDGSTDGTIEFLRQQKPACRLRIAELPHRGQATARNHGMKLATGELVLFLDDDILCDRLLLQAHAHAHADAPPRVVFGPILLARESSRTLAAEWRRLCFEKAVARLELEGEPRDWNDFNVAANYSLPRVTALACGGFDERFASAREDREFGVRLRKRGARFRYQPSARTWELYFKSTSDSVRRDAAELGRKEVLLCRTHPDYRHCSALASLDEGPLWRRVARSMALGAPVSPDFLLRAPCWLAERLQSFAAARRIGIRLLEIRMATEFYRSAMREAGSRKALRQMFGLRLPVLAYHRVAPGRPGSYPELTISPELFRRQVRWLSRHGYVGVDSSAWLAWRREGKPLPAKPVLFTFDDAYADITEFALPVLREHGFSALVFVVTGLVGKTMPWDGKQAMTQEQIRHWARQGIVFGAHSNTHPDLTKLAPQELAEEVERSSQELRRIVGARPIAFAYPYGGQNAQVRDAVQSVFNLAFTMDEGQNTILTDPWLLRRIEVSPRDSLVDFSWRVRLGYSPLRNLRRWASLRQRITNIVRRFDNRW